MYHALVRVVHKSFDRVCVCLCVCVCVLYRNLWEFLVESLRGFLDSFYEIIWDFG